jgi:hypothetical protein
MVQSCAAVAESNAIEKQSILPVRRLFASHRCPHAPVIVLQGFKTKKCGPGQARRLTGTAGGA